MLARRMLMFVAVLFAITALAAAFAPPPPRGALATLPSIITPPATARDVITRAVDAGAAHPPTITVSQGDRLVLSVTGAALDSVELEGLSGVRPIGPDAVASFDVVTDDAGTYPLVLVSTGKRIATIDVTPPPRQGLAPAGPLIHRTRDT